MKWRIEFCLNKIPDKIFIHKFFYYLVSKGVRYNAIDAGAYFIFGVSPDKDIEHIEPVKGEKTEKLANIIEDYISRDLSLAHFSVLLNYCGTVNYCFWIIMYPANDKFKIAFEADELCIPDENSFMSMIDICKDVFEKFNFEFGAFRNEEQRPTPVNEEAFVKEKPYFINFYSKSIVVKIGREKLLLTPAMKIEELENGGMMIVVRPENIGYPQELLRV